MTLNTSIIRQTLRNVKFGIRKKYIATLSLSLQSSFTTWVGYMPFLSKKIIQRITII